MGQDTTRRQLSEIDQLNLGQSLDEILRQLIEALGTPEGKSLLESAAQKANKVTEEFDEKLRLNPSFLYEQNSARLLRSSCDVAGPLFINVLGCGRPASIIVLRHQRPA